MVKQFQVLLKASAELFPGAAVPLRSFHLKTRCSENTVTGTCTVVSFNKENDPSAVLCVNAGGRKGRAQGGEDRGGCRTGGGGRGKRRP